MLRVHRRALSITGLLATLVLAVLLAGCGSASTTATATATTAPTATATPVISQSYTSTDGVYQVGYPGGWQAQALTIDSTSGTAQIASADGNDLVLIEPFIFKSDASYPDILKSAIGGSDFTNSSVDSATTTQTLPSGTWTLASGTTAVSGTPYTAHLYGMLHNEKTIIIITLLPASATADQSTYINPILNSFTFLK